MTKNKQSSKKPLIANYELNNYSYTQFWQGRAYEDQAERIAIRNLLASSPAGDRHWFLDLGGSYGRLLDEYVNLYNQVIILDYATTDFPIAYQRSLELGKEVHFIAANAYKLPLADNSLDGGICVRVLHHLETPELFFAELYRVLKPGANFTLEFANKNHLKAVIKQLLKGKLSWISQESHRVPHRHDSQGINTERGQESVIFNFSYPYIRKLLKEAGFCLEAKRGVSWWRFPLLKKLVPGGLLLLLEKLTQICFSWTNLAPSIFLTLQKPILSEKSVRPTRIEDLLVDPASKRPLKSSEVKNAQKRLSVDQKKKTVWDLRDPRPEEISY